MEGSAFLGPLGFATRNRFCPDRYSSGMSSKAVIGWLVVAVVLGLGVVLAFRAGGGSGDGLAVGSCIFDFGPSTVRKVTIGPANGVPDVIERAESADGE